MNNLIASKYFLSEIAKMRDAIHDNLIQLMEKYNATEVECYECDDCPIVFSGMDDDCMTLDRIIYHNINGNKVVTFDCSGSWNNTSVCVSQMDIEMLIATHDWIFANEEYLFNQDNDE